MSGRPYKIWARVERRRVGYRAIAAAFPQGLAEGPHPNDIRLFEHARKSEVEEALGLLVHGLATDLHRRGDVLSSVDLRRW